MSLRFSLDSSETAAAPACFSHFRPPFRLISLHERRSRNMMARIGGHFRLPFRLISLQERRSRNMTARIGGASLRFPLDNG